MRKFLYKTGRGIKNLFLEFWGLLVILVIIGLIVLLGWKLIDNQSRECQSDLNAINRIAQDDPKDIDAAVNLYAEHCGG